ncbi:MAG: hypothetical protein JXB24_15175 [Bacteroidales bacterium]|nr:hypothetical protein [Bacteroidales bacterium]
MVVGPGQVHGMRILRRDLWLKIETPNFCAQYHRDKSDLSSGDKNRETIKIAEKGYDLNPVSAQALPSS